MLPEWIAVMLGYRSIRKDPRGKYLSDLFLFKYRIVKQSSSHKEDISVAAVMHAVGEEYHPHARVVVHVQRRTRIARVAVAAQRHTAAAWIESAAKQMEAKAARLYRATCHIAYRHLKGEDVVNLLKRRLNFLKQN